MNIQDFRKNHPAYDDMSDKELADALYDKYYAKDMERSDFYKQAGVKVDDSALRGFAAGLTKPIDKLAEYAMKIPGVPAVDRFLSDVTGTPDVATHNAMNEAVRQNNTRTGYQMAGNVVGTLPTAALPGGSAVQGAASGALLTDATDAKGIAKDMALSAATSYGADKALKFVGEGVRPYVDKGVRKLHEMGVPLTVGQIAGATNTKVGNVIRNVEDQVTGLPFVGPMVSGARQRGVVKYNQAVLDRALSHIGAKLPAGVSPGRDSVLWAGNKVSQAYDDLLPNLTAQADDLFKQDMQGIAQQIGVLPEETQKQFGKIIKQAWGNRAFDEVLAGADLKDVESLLGVYASKFSASTDANQQILAEALRTTQGSLRSLVERSNPNYAGQLQAANAAWRELATAEKAAASVGSTDGIFSARQYARAARDADKSVRHRATARGTVPNQDVTDAAAATLSNPVNDSGTAGRAMIPYLLMGGGAGVGGVAGGAAVGTGAALGAGMAPYTSVGQKALAAALLGKRPDALRYGAVNLSYLSPYFAPALTVGGGDR